MAAAVPDCNWQIRRPARGAWSTRSTPLAAARRCTAEIACNRCIRPEDAAQGQAPAPPLRGGGADVRLDGRRLVPVGGTVRRHPGLAAHLDVRYHTAMGTGAGAGDGKVRLGATSPCPTHCRGHRARDRCSAGRLPRSGRRMIAWGGGSARGLSDWQPHGGRAVRIVPASEAE